MAIREATQARRRIDTSHLYWWLGATTDHVTEFMLNRTPRQAWEQCPWPSTMVRLAERVGYDDATTLRLYVCRCIRQEPCWSLLTNASRAAVEVAERYARGEATDDELAAAHASARCCVHNAWSYFQAVNNTDGEYYASHAKWSAALSAAKACRVDFAHVDAFTSAEHAASADSWVRSGDGLAAGETPFCGKNSMAAAEKQQAKHLRELIPWEIIDVIMKAGSWYGEPPDGFDEGRWG